MRRPDLVELARKLGMKTVCDYDYCVTIEKGRVVESWIDREEGVLYVDGARVYRAGVEDGQGFVYDPSRAEELSRRYHPHRVKFIRG